MRRPVPLSTILLAALLLLAGPSLGASFMPLGSLPSLGDMELRDVGANATRSEATSLSADGRVVTGWGTIAQAAAPGGVTSAFFRARDGVVEDLPELTGGSTAGAHVSPDGSSVFFARSGDVYTWIGDEVTATTFVGTRVDRIRASTPDGSTYVGSVSALSGGGAYAVDDGVLTRLVDPGGRFRLTRATGVSADGRFVLGQSDGEIGEPQDLQSFLLDREEDTLSILLEADGSSAAGSSAGPLTPDGRIAVGITRENLTPQLFRWTESTGIVRAGIAPSPGLGFPSDLFFPSGVSADGDVIVGNLLLTNRATVWDPEHGYRNLHDALEAEGIDLTGWTLEDAVGVSANGRVVAGNGIAPDGHPTAFIATLGRVPEPRLAPLMLGTLGAGLGLVRRAGPRFGSR